MWNKAFEQLRQRLTFTYAAIFGVLILIIVAVAYTLIWWAILAHEKQELVSKIYHEAEEWIAIREEPCSAVAIQTGSMLAYFVAPDGKTVILNQLGDGNVGKALMRHRDEWPKKMDTARLLRMHGGKNEPSNTRYRYLAAVAPVKDGDKVYGRLYMFKNFEFYYTAAFNTLFWLLCVALVLFSAACAFGYWLAGRNIKPISLMYRRQQQFTADASHEMRTPLAVMRLAVQGMQEDTDSTYSDFSKESLSMLQSENRRMTRLTEELMELARSDEGILPVAQEKLDFTAICTETGKHMEFVAASHGLLLKQKIADGLTVQGDEHRLRRLLVILLDNAIKYGAEGGTISFDVAKKDDRICIRVADYGCGISDEDKEKVFDRFYRVDKARSRAQGGLGLGLSLALAIVKQHHGKIQILDNKPCGTVMQVLL